MTEFDRQLQRLIDLGYPALAGLPEGDFTDLLAPLREAAGPGGPPDGGRVPYVLVVTRDLVPIEQAVPLTALAGRSRPGIVDRLYPEGDLARFTPTVELPAGRAYLLLDIDRGEEFCGAVPRDAMAVVAGRGRTLLTVEEGVAVVTQYPELLATNKCFSLGASRCGDRRVPALWISKGAPKLGWCWEGNPHTWLGMASAGGRA
ncbi:DUF5701 family protein [Kitasatospora sp. NPDC051914]|uniref:DUF5701 family protein n=1 Tax=Kitasatospora sp. NPDC051914 TaxID=3154945 RepID=UPI00344A3F04